MKNRASELLALRMAWCREQKALASTEPELDGWRAEEDGLRDALLNRDPTDDYRLCDPEVFERYLLGFQDGTALRCAARMERVLHAAAAHEGQWRPSDSTCP